MALFREALDPETSLIINVALMTNVKNVPELRSMVRSGSLQCCLIKPSLIVDPVQILIAANKAALKNKYSNMITKSVFTEILFNLSISKQITNSLNLFGIANTDTSVLIVVLEKPNEDNVPSVLSHIKGQNIDIEKLQQLTDEQLVKQTYGIKGKELEVSSLIDSVISRVAAKDILIQHD